MMRPRDSSPFRARLTSGKGTAYVTTYFMIEDFLAYLK